MNTMINLVDNNVNIINIIELQIFLCCFVSEGVYSSTRQCGVALTQVELIIEGPYSVTCWVATFIISGNSEVIQRRKCDFITCI